MVHVVGGATSLLHIHIEPLLKGLYGKVPVRIMPAPEGTLRLFAVCGWQTMPMALATIKAFLEMALLSF